MCTTLPKTSGHVGLDFPFETPRRMYSKVIEVDGKLWLYALDGHLHRGSHLQETFVYDPATQTWTAGPRLTS